MLERLAEWDRLIFCIVNADWSNDVLDVFFALITHLGQGAVLGIIGLLAFYCFDRKNFPKNFIVVGVIVLLGGLWVQIIKGIVDRPRPLADPDLFLMQFGVVKTYVLGFIDKVAYLLDPESPMLAWVKEVHVIGPQWKHGSFPSGHTQAAFGVAFALAWVFRRRWLWLLFVPAALVGLSRMYVGVHFPLDVLAGATIGITNSWVLLALTRRYTGLGLVRPKDFTTSASLPDKPSILMVAGEASADTYAANLITAIKEKLPGAMFTGIGGDQAVSVGLEPLGRASDIAVVGFTGVITGLRKIRRLYDRVLKFMDRKKPDLYICLDLPDFNLALANQAKARGIPVLYYISPQVWAWRAGRIKTIADRVDHMVVALPFEKELYQREGVDCTFAGHPILETIAPQDRSKEEVRADLGLSVTKKVIVLAPGSRKNEIRHLAAPLAAAAREIERKLHDVEFAVPLASTVDENEVKGYFRKEGIEPKFIKDQFYDLLACADAGAITSGTATLEAALAGLPHVICYRGNWLNITLAKMLVKTDKIGLPNIILGRLAFAELIQVDCTPSEIGKRLLSLLAGNDREASLSACAEVRERLDRGEVSRKVAEVVVDLIAKRRKPIAL